MSDTRKIIHVDMDAFYASVEQRDNPELRGKPVAVGSANARGVVATASYEARKFGVHSAMASATAKRLCPGLIFVPGRRDVYKAVSQQIRAIFAQYTDTIEPVSLDEAYLDVTTNKKHIPSAWAVAQNIRDKIYATTGLTASAGISYNKFLAKSASDMNKPNGQYLITPDKSAAYIAALPVTKFHGIGPATAEKMHRLGITNGADLLAWQLEDLKLQFGKLGAWYYAIARGQDDRPVQPYRERKSVSAETTFKADVTDKDHLLQTIATLAGEVWEWIAVNKTYGRTVTIKVKWADFEQVTRSHTKPIAITDLGELRATASELLDSIFPLHTGIRLVGVGVSNFRAQHHKETLQIRLDFEN